MNPRVLLLASLLAGCASTGESSSGGPGMPTRVVAGSEMQVADQATTSSTSVALPAARAFQAAQAAYAALGIEVGELDQAGLVVGNPQVQVRRTLAGRPGAYFLDCGTSSTGRPLANTHRVQFSIRTAITPADAGSSVVSTIVSNGSARDMSGISGDPVRCVSTGALEQLIGEQVRRAADAAAR